MSSTQKLHDVLREAVSQVLAAYGEARFPDEPPIDFELHVDAPALRLVLAGSSASETNVENDPVEVRGHLSAPLLLAAEAWGAHLSRLDHRGRAMLEPPISQNGDVENPVDRPASAALARAGLAWIEAGHRQEGLFCLARGAGAVQVEVPPELEEAARPTTACDNVNATTPNALAGKVAPFAEHDDPWERRACARRLHSALYHLIYSDRLAFDKRAGAALETLARDAVSCIRQEALRALDFLTWKLWCEAAYVECVPHLELLIDARWHSDLQLLRLWESQLAAEELDADATWAHLERIADPDESLRLAANFFEHGDWTDARIVGLERVSRAHLEWARGADPCSDRLRRRRKFVPPKANIRQRHLDLARQHLADARALGAERLERDLREQEQLDQQENDARAGRRGFWSDLEELASQIEREDGDAVKALEFLVKADAIDQRLGLAWRRGRLDSAMLELAETLEANQLDGIDLPRRIADRRQVADAPAEQLTPAHKLVAAALVNLRQQTCDAAGTPDEWPWPEDLHVELEEDQLVVRVGERSWRQPPSTVRLLALRTWDALVETLPPFESSWAMKWPSPYALSDDDTEEAWRELGRQLLETGHRTEAVRCLRRGHGSHGRKVPADEVADLTADIAEQVTAKCGAEKRFDAFLATGTKKPSRPKQLKFLAQEVAESTGWQDRLWLAEALHEALSLYAPSQVLTRLKTADDALDGLVKTDCEDGAAAHEAALFARGELCRSLVQEKAFAEALDGLDELIDGGLQAWSHRYDRWLCRLVLGLREEAAEDQAALFPSRFSQSAEADGRRRAAEALLAWADGDDPCEARRRPAPPAAAPTREQQRRLALEILEPALRFESLDDDDRKWLQDLADRAKGLARDDDDDDEWDDE